MQPWTVWTDPDINSKNLILMSDLPSQKSPDISLYLINLDGYGLRTLFGIN